MVRPRVLVADDKDNILSLFSRILGHRFDVVTANDGQRALALGLADDFDVVVSDIRMPGVDGFALLRELKRSKPDVEVVLMTAYGTVQKAVEAMKEGAYDYLSKPFEPEEALLTIERAAERKSLREQARSLSAALERALVVADCPCIPLQALPEEVAEQSNARVASELSRMGFREAVGIARDRASREYLIALMREFHGSVTHAAERAGIERETLHRLLKRYGLRSEEFKKR